MKLNLGCGKDYKIGYINVDRVKSLNPDKVWDLNKLPLPFKTNSIDEICMSHVLEHINKRKLKKFFIELHRITKQDGVIRISVPYYASPYSVLDLEHENYFSWGTIKYAVDEEYHNYEYKSKFTIEKQSFGMLSSIPIWKTIIPLIANIHPRFYERFLATIIPVDMINIEMKPVKKEKK